MKLVEQGLCRAHGTYTVSLFHHSTAHEDVTQGSISVAETQVNTDGCWLHFNMLFLLNLKKNLKKKPKLSNNIHMHFQNLKAT